MNNTPTEITIGKSSVIAVNANRPLRTGPITLDNYVRHPKNPHIANFFVQMGYAEHLGTGIKNIYKYTKLYTSKEHIFDDDNVFKVLIKLPLELGSTIKNANLYMEVQKKVQKKGILITNRQLDVLVRMAINPSITRHQLTNELSVSIKNINDSISALKKLSLLERRGGKKSGQWIVLLPNINTEL